MTFALGVGTGQGPDGAERRTPHGRDARQRTEGGAEGAAGCTARRRAPCTAAEPTGLPTSTVRYSSCWCRCLAAAARVLELAGVRPCRTGHCRGHGRAGRAAPGPGWRAGPRRPNGRAAASGSGKRLPPALCLGSAAGGPARAVPASPVAERRDRPGPGAATRRRRWRRPRGLRHGREPGDGERDNGRAASAEPRTPASAARAPANSAAGPSPQAVPPPPPAASLRTAGLYGMR